LSVSTRMKANRVVDFSRNLDFFSLAESIDRRGDS
jgi:hypothetical protein